MEWNDIRIDNKIEIEEQTYLIKDIIIELLRPESEIRKYNLYVTVYVAMLWLFSGKISLKGEYILQMALVVYLINELYLK